MPPGDSCAVVRSALMFEGRQDLQFFAGIAAETVGAKRICMHLLTIPPRSSGRAHKHELHETAIYVIKGSVTAYYGPDLTESLQVSAGEFLYIPASMPHQPVNNTDQPVEVVLARTDPSEQESVILLPELEAEQRERGPYSTEPESTLR